MFIPLFGGCVSLISAFVSVANARRADRTYKLQEQQELRKRPNLAISLDASGYRKDSDSRIYELSATFLNRSDTNTSISRFELKLNYRNREGFKTSVLVQSSTCPETAEPKTSFPPITSPQRIDANQTLAGQLCFVVPLSMFYEREIETYSLVATDVHDNHTSVDIVLIGALTE